MAIAFPYSNVNGYYLSTGNIHHSKIVAGKTLENDPILSRVKKLSVIVSKDESVSLYLGSYDLEGTNIPLITYRDIVWNSNYSSQLLDFFTPLYKIIINYTGNNFKIFIYKTIDTSVYEYVMETGTKMSTNYVRSFYKSLHTPYNSYSGYDSMKEDPLFTNYSNFSIRFAYGQLYLTDIYNVIRAYDISSVNLFNFEQNTYLASEAFKLSDDSFFQIIKSGHKLLVRFYNTDESSEYFIHIHPFSESYFPISTVLFTILAIMILLFLVAFGVYTYRNSE